MPDKIQILVADDHTLFRQGLINLLNEARLFEIIAEASDGTETLQKIRELKPQIAIVDIEMPGLNGLEIVRAIKNENFPVEFVILTMYKEEEYFNAAMDLGVKGYLLKDNAISDLINCIKSVASGKYFVSPMISDYLINRHERTKSFQQANPALEALSTTEKQILKLISENKTSREIANELYISYRTVQNHRTNICEKLGLKGYNKLLQFALENKAYLNAL